MSRKCYGFCVVVYFLRRAITVAACPARTPLQGPARIMAADTLLSASNEKTKTILSMAFLDFFIAPSSILIVLQHLKGDKTCIQGIAPTNATPNKPAHFREFLQALFSGTNIGGVDHRRDSFRWRSRYHGLLRRLSCPVCSHMWVIRVGSLCIFGGHLYDRRNAVRVGSPACFPSPCHLG